MFLRMKFFKQVFFGLFLIFAVTAIGTTGFYILEDFTFLEALYMSVITLSTVGYKEVRTLSDEGMIFTIIFIVSSFGIFAYTITRITSYILSGEYRQYVKQYKILKALEKLTNHTIICGFGRVGRQAAEQLIAYGETFVVIELEEFEQDSVEGKDPINRIIGNATDDEILKKAGIERAKALITALPSDADNMFVVVSAKELNKNLKVISRASTTSAAKKLRIAGANNVILPNSLGGSHMASLVVHPDVMDFLDQISIQGSSEMTLESVSFDNLPKGMKNKTIGDLVAAQTSGCNVIGYKQSDGSFIVNPPLDTELVHGSSLIILGNPRQLDKLHEILA